MIDRNPIRFRGSRGLSPGALKLVAEFKAAGRPRVYRFIETGVEEDSGVSTFGAQPAVSPRASRDTEETTMTVDTFAGTGIRSIVQALTPKGTGWREIPADPRISNGGPIRAFLHNSGLAVFSAVEYVGDAGEEPKQEYHLSISQQTPAGPKRCSSMVARDVLRIFGAEGALEDNHVPFGRVRNFWRPVAAPLVGIVCECNEAEAAIVEDKGDFVWRGLTP